MSKPKIDPGTVPPPRVPEVRKGRPDAEKYFTFSFRYWKEVENFGVGSQDASWFSSLLARLRDLGSEKITRLFEDPSFKDTLRSHRVDWGAKNIPVQLEDLNWLPASVRENQDEFPIIQFHVSKALGRVHGFWDAEWCFQIVLLDPLHNLQPSEYSAYKVRSTDISNCQYSALRTALDQVCETPCSQACCEFARRVHTVTPEAVDGHIVIVAALEENVAGDLATLRAASTASISDILSHGILFFDEQPPSGAGSKIPQE